MNLHSVLSGRTSRSLGILAALMLCAALLVAPAGAGAAKSEREGVHAVASISCSSAKKAVKRAKKAVKRAKKALKKAQRSGPAAKIKKAKKRLKKAKKRLKKAKKRQRAACGSSGGGAAWVDGRYQGTWAENSTDLSFNVVGSRLYTGPFDSFYIDATCHNVDPTFTGNQVYTDGSAIEPVQATIASGGNFSGSGTYVPGGGEQIHWTVSGHISGQSVTGGTFSVNYTDFYGNPCSGTAHFTAQWYGAYTL
jgi:hypothetical protein